MWAMRKRLCGLEAVGKSYGYLWVMWMMGDWVGDCVVSSVSGNEGDECLSD